MALEIEKAQILPFVASALFFIAFLCFASSARAQGQQEEGSAAAVVRMEPSTNSSPIPDFDMKQLTARSIQERQIRQPVVQWETLTGTFAACPRPTSKKDLNLPDQGCVVIDTAQNRCNIYTGSRTTHSIMGHLIRHCFEGHL